MFYKKTIHLAHFGFEKYALGGRSIYLNKHSSNENTQRRGYEQRGLNPFMQNPIYLHKLYINFPCLFFRSKLI